jgi:hypothetical protein
MVALALVVAVLMSARVSVVAAASNNSGADSSGIRAMPDRAGACINGAPSMATDTTSKRDAANVKLNGTVIVSPALLDVGLPLNAGDQITCVITIRNRRKNRTTFDLVPVGVLGSKSGDASIRFVAANGNDAGATAASWIKPAVASVTLPPRGVASVPVLISVPSSPPTGGVFGAIDVAPRLRADAAVGDATNLGVESRASIGVLLRIGGEGAAKFVLDKASAPLVRWAQDPWTWRAQLDNDGNAAARPVTTIQVKSLFGGTAAKLRNESRALLPGGRTLLVREWDNVPIFGIFRYEATVKPAGDDPGSTATDSGWIIALPPWWVIALFVGLLALIIGGAIVRRRRERAWAEYDDEDSVGDAGLDRA